MGGLLSGVRAPDVVLLVSVAALLTMTAVAVFVPVLRATWIEPSRFHHRDLWMVTTAL